MLHFVHNFAEKKGCGGAGSPKHFLANLVNPQIIYHFASNILENPNPFEFLENVLIS